MICNKCNHSLPDDSEFCQYCGIKIENKIEIDEVVEEKNEKEINESVSASYEKNDVSKSEPSKNMLKNTQKKSKFVLIYNIFNIVLSSISILAIVIAMTAQDADRAIYEEINPSIIYFVFLCGLGCYLGLSINSLIRYKYRLTSWLSWFLAGYALFAGVEGSVFSSKRYYRFANIYTVYINAELVHVCNVIWICCISAIAILATLVIFIDVINYIKTVWYSSIMHRERCYKRISKMHNYLERGIITENEFEEARKQIISKIRR